MTSHICKLIFLPVLLASAPPVLAAPWWYVDRGADRVLFIDAGSIDRDKNIVTYSSKNIIRDSSDPTAMTMDFMRADCGKRQIGRLAIQRFSREDKVIDTSTGGSAEMMNVPSNSVADSELRFVCSDGGAREGHGHFVLAIDDAAFTDALISGRDKDLSPRALHDRMSADPRTPVIRSSAAGPASFGSVQTVKTGDPIVPPRDYAQGPHIPVATDYSAVEVGRIYDIAYEGIRNGQLQFEVRGYSIDDLVHPGSGQTHLFPITTKTVHVRDIAITIKAARPNAITYSVAIEKEIAPIFDTCTPDVCDAATVTMDAAKVP